MDENKQNTPNDDDFKPLDKEKIEIKAKERIKQRKAKAKKNRHEYQKKRVIVPAITAGLLILLGIFAAIHSTYFQSTDDAFVEGRLITVAPRVSGPAIQLLVDDNDEVKAGDLLVEIDPADYEVKLKEAEAKLAQAKAELNVTEKEVEKGEANVNQTFEDISSTQAKLNFAQKDHTRYTAMYKAGIVSKQDFENSKTKLEVSQADNKAAAERSQAAKHALASNQAKTESMNANIQRLEAEVEQAKLNLKYTKIYAPQSGKVSARSVEKGNYLQVGQPLMQIVPKEVWVVANFKEIQLTNMKEHQPVSIKIDTYPNKRFKGEVQSIQRATGAKSSLFPPENAVGSYVKIVQRVPVKIIFKEDISDYNIVPGMSVVPKVKVK
ncbi:TPA: HlyD family secretion protein [Candidatus Scatousia excrementigallinarum]|uniref:HlyD family secretion protein n=1 Tax=Candidatus Scatousia excrementigallinarum TaxID=2840935 RepID=A0A9D1EYE4_9BACT|nr:HlyD family secretion protein [Candidatus Scatousia excrementigallinarum]